MFFSDPFYATPGGYKMCIRVDTNGAGAGEGTHVLVFTEILEGRYDDQLHWPFQGTVTYELLNQLTDDKHYSRIAIHNAGCFVPSNHSLLSADKQTNKQTYKPNMIIRSSLGIHVLWFQPESSRDTSHKNLMTFITHETVNIRKNHATFVSYRLLFFSPFSDLPLLPFNS